MKTEGLFLHVYLNITHILISLFQVAYETGQYTLVKKACNEIWSHFTLPSVTDSGAGQGPLDKEAPERLAKTKLDNHISEDYLPNTVSNTLSETLPILFVLCISIKIVPRDIAALLSSTATAFPCVNLYADRHPD